MRYKRRRSGTPAPNPLLSAAILEIVDNQLADDNPPETRQTFDRLVREGHTPEEARRLIASVVVSEIFEVMQRGEPYNQTRFVAALARLPRLPGEH